MGGCVGGSTATVVCRLAGVSCAAEMRELGFGLVGNLRPPPLVMGQADPRAGDCAL